MRLLLLGCTGFVGRELVPALLEADHQLTLVSRRLARGYEAERADGRVKWLQLDPAKSVSWQTPELVEALSTSDAVVNLAGEPIAEKRWTAVHRKVLEDSRLETTRLLVDALAASKSPPSVLINASAIGFFGTSPPTNLSNPVRQGPTSLPRYVNAGRRLLPPYPIPSVR
jgi:NAD dependent epimerase/dehydratase family enzyme